MRAPAVLSLLCASLLLPAHAAPVPPPAASAPAREPSVQALLDVLKTGVGPEVLQARRALLERGSEALEALRQADRGRLPAMARAQFTWLHGALGDASAADLLTGRLEDPNPLVREEACRALGRIRAASAAPKLRDLLKDGEILVQEAAARALGRLGDAESAGDLCALLEDAHQSVSLRAAAAEALGLLEPARVRASLVGALRRDPSAVVRRAAVDSLRRMTGMDRCYDPEAAEPQREAATKSWEEWLAEQGG